MNNSIRLVTKIKYKQKDFFILKNNDGKYTFLEIKDGIVTRPLLKDYIELGLIYSNPKDHFFADNKRTIIKSGVIFNGIVLSTALILGILNSSVTNKTLLDNFKSSIICEEAIDLGIDIDSNQITEEEFENHFIEKLPTNEPTRPQTIEEKDFDVENYTKKITFHEPEALKEYLTETNVTKEQVLNSIEENKNIDDTTKEIIIDYVNTMMDYYPGIDMDMFNDNIKTLSIKKITKEQLEENSEGCKAYYNAYKNTIFLNENIKLTEDSKDMVILRHELTHMINEYYRKNNEYTLYLETSKMENYYTKEALTVIMSTVPFENRYSEQTRSSMGYELTSNIIRTLLVSLPNASIQSIYTSNIDDFKNYLSENIKSDINSKKFLDLIEIISSEYYNSDVHMNENNREQIFKYIADSYNKNIINENTSEEEVNEILNYMNNQLRNGINNNNLINFNIIEETINNNANKKTL